MSFGTFLSTVFKGRPKLQIDEKVVHHEEEDLRDYRPYCEDIIKSFQNHNINLFAVDFDLTLIDEHTGGVFVGTAEDLQPRIRPLFRTLVPMLVDRGIQVAVVTFSPQVNLVADVLKLEYKDCYMNIVIRGCDGSWDSEGLTRRDGKQKHMQSAINEINSKTSTAVSLSSTILVDDDPNNIRVARANAVKAVRCYPENPGRLVNDLIKLKESPITPMTA